MILGKQCATQMGLSSFKDMVHSDSSISTSSLSKCSPGVLHSTPSAGQRACRLLDQTELRA